MRQRRVANEGLRPRRLVAIAVSAAGCLGLSAAGAQVGGEIAVPSGQVVTYQDTISTAPGPGGLVIRFRFVAPAIARDGGTVTPEVAQEDMEFLCRTYALPRLSETGPVPDQVVISLADRELPFGEASPDATQFFEAYRVEGATCIWEAF